MKNISAHTIDAKNTNRYKSYTGLVNASTTTLSNISNGDVYVMAVVDGADTTAVLVSATAATVASVLGKGTTTAFDIWYIGIASVTTDTLTLSCGGVSLGLDATAGTPTVPCRVVINVATDGGVSAFGINAAGEVTAFA